MEYPDTPIVQRYVILTGDSTLPLAVNVSVSNCVYVHCSLIGWGQVKLNEGHVIELTSQERSFLIITPPYGWLLCNVQYYYPAALRHNRGTVCIKGPDVYSHH